MNDKLEKIHLAWLIYMPTCAMMWGAVAERDNLGNGAELPVLRGFVIVGAVLGVVMTILLHIKYRRSGCGEWDRWIMPQVFAQNALMAISMAAAYIGLK